MARLQEVLEDASARSAYELVMESGQPVVLTTPQGPEALGDPLAEGELIDALTEVLDDEQQVELAVGNLIEFHIQTDGGRWTLISEPVADGVLVRGRLQPGKGEAVAGRGGALDLPALDPFSPPATGEPLDAPDAGADAGRASRPTVQDVPADFGSPATERPKRHGSSELDVDVSLDLDGPSAGGTLVAGPGAFPPPEAPAKDAPPAAAAPSFDDLDFGAPASSAGGTSDATLFSPAGGPAPIPSMGPAEPLDTSSAADLGFGAPDPNATPPAPDLGFGAPVPPASQSASDLGFGAPHGNPTPAAVDLAFGVPDAAPRSKEQHGTLIMGSDAPRPDESSLGIPDDDDDSSFADLNMDLEDEPPSFEPPPSRPSDSGQLESPPGVPAAPPAAPVTSGAAGERLADLAISIEPGTLCFVHGDGAAEELAGYIGVPVAVVEDGPDGTRAVRSLLGGGAEPGTVVVHMEDPSAQLGFLLRRLEEGWRVLVETQARTAEGARRVLLGVDATAVAEAWLDAQVTSWAMVEEGRWKLL